MPGESEGWMTIRLRSGGGIPWFLNLKSFDGSIFRSSTADAECVEKYVLVGRWSVVGWLCACVCPRQKIGGSARETQRASSFVSKLRQVADVNLKLLVFTSFFILHSNIST